MTPAVAERIQKIRVAAGRREHGSRARYIAGCRCLPCRAANSRYSCERQRARKHGDERETVSAERAVLHIRELSGLGVGYKSVADAGSVCHTIVRDMLDGRRTMIRKDTERKILNVDENARAGGSLVSATRTWELLDELIGLGYAKKKLAGWLGRNAIQFKRTSITFRNAVAVEKLHRGIKAGRYTR